MIRVDPTRARRAQCDAGFATIREVGLENLASIRNHGVDTGSPAIENLGKEQNQ
jgi:hypothetical protein